MKKLVSIIIPTKNRPKLLVESVKSALNQTYQYTELIVVDDGSDIHPSKILNKVNKLAIYDNQFKGAASAKNTGIINSKGEIIVFLDDDDKLAPESIEKIVSIFTKNHNVNIIFMLYDFFGKYSKEAKKSNDEQVKAILKKSRSAKKICMKVYLTSKTLFKYLVITTPLPFQNPAVRREALEKIGMFDVDFKLLWDVDWTLRAALTTKSVITLERLKKMRVDGQNSITRGDRLADRENEFKCILQKLKALTENHPDKSFHQAVSKRLSGIYYQESISFKENKIKTFWSNLKAMYYYFEFRQVKLIAKLFVPKYFYRYLKYIYKIVT
ncbi:glycosyltransferase [Patescibacteria group bacterium]|nr:glycosyltransferase [Patescibacteria group bacterium]